MNTKIKDTEYDWRSPEVFHTLSQNLLNPLWCSFVLLQRFCIPLQFFFLSGTDAWPLFTRNKELCIYSSSDSCFSPNSTFLSLWGFLCVFFSYLLIPIQGHEVLHFTQFISTPAPQGPELWNIFSFSQCIAICMSAYTHTYVKEWVSLCILSFEVPKVKKKENEKKSYSLTWADTLRSWHIFDPPVEPDWNAAGGYSTRRSLSWHFHCHSQQVHLFPGGIQHIVLPSQTTAITINH